MYITCSIKAPKHCFITARKNVACCVITSHICKRALKLNHLVTSITEKNVDLLVLDISTFENSVNPDQMASEEAI